MDPIAIGSFMPEALLLPQEQSGPAPVPASPISREPRQPRRQIVHCVSAPRQAQLRARTQAMPLKNLSFSKFLNRCVKGIKRVKNAS
jgi:hypothetical protein